MAEAHGSAAARSERIAGPVRVDATPWRLICRHPIAGALALGALLAGCDNTSVKVTDSGWKELAMNKTQLPIDPKYPTISIAEGDGARVKAGDLVKLRIGDGRINADKTPYLQEGWYWTGSLPEDYNHYGATWPTPLGALLVRRHVGDKFELVPQDASTYRPRITLTGMPPPQPNSKGFGHISAFSGPASAWDNFTLRTATYEILATCPVQLSVRKGEMTQWGFILNMFGSSYPIDRRGTLYWSAIDADCPAPDGKVRFMIGPIYVSATSGTGQEAYRNETLYNFADAYLAERPKAKYPDEYQYVVIGDKWIRREVRNQQLVDVAVPVVHGPPPPGSGR
jgi:hypothetical protein